MASSPRSAEQRGSEPILRVQGVSKNFGGIAALKHVSFDMVLGEVRAICGENGAGKSTLVKIITGVYRPDEGSVSIAGDAQPIANPRQAQARGARVERTASLAVPRLADVAAYGAAAQQCAVLGQRPLQAVCVGHV